MQIFRYVHHLFSSNLSGHVGHVPPSLFALQRVTLKLLIKGRNPAKVLGKGGLDSAHVLPLFRGLRRHASHEAFVILPRSSASAVGKLWWTQSGLGSSSSAHTKGPRRWHLAIISNVCPFRVWRTLTRLCPRRNVGRHSVPYALEARYAARSAELIGGELQKSGQVAAGEVSRCETQ